MAKPESYIIDTNVLCICEGLADHVDLQSRDECIVFVESVKTRGCVHIDNLYMILREYESAVLSGNRCTQPGVGGVFIRWLHQNRKNPERCKEVQITPKKKSPDDYEEFPQDPRLADFHRKDRKFVAVAVASDLAPEIVNASDSDWENHRDVFRELGVRLRFLCPNLCLAGGAS